MKFGSKSALAVAMALFATGPAAAATVYLDAAAGHVQQSFGTVNWKDAQTDSDSTWLKVSDGRTINVGQPNPGSTITKTWVVHIPVSSSNINWNSTARGSSWGFDGLNQRICTFTSSGAFSTCGNPVQVNAVSTAFVPSEGTAFSQTVLQGVCIFGGFCDKSGTLASIKANN